MMMIIIIIIIIIQIIIIGFIVGKIKVLHNSLSVTVVM
jgi:hypothetical protein